MTSVLNPFLYFWRNLGRTLPMAFVITLAVVLVASIVSIVDSIDLTVYTLYGYNRYLTGITPRNSLSIDPDVIAAVRKAPDLGDLYQTHSYVTFVKTIFGKMPLPIFGLNPAGRALVRARCGVRLAAGRLPAEGQPEAVVSDDVARNLGLRVGSIISKPESEDSYAPVPIRLVGLLHGPVWLGLTSKRLVDTYSPFTYTGYMAFARSARPAAQRRLDNEIERVVDKGRARVWRFSGLVRETQSALSNLYLILGIVIGIVVFAISFVSGLLANIYFTQRLPEIATLSAIGYSRRFLLLRAVAETVIFCTLGWLLGSAATIGLLVGIREVAMTPRGLLLNPVDAAAYLYTLPLPATIVTFAVATIALRLASLDPVSIIERRA